jgi:protein phosphatase
VALPIPEGSLVVLVGPAGCGKTTFARVNFRPTQVLSSDFFRGLVADDENDQSATPQAFAILRFIAVRRLRRGRLTVIDATNVRRQDRRALLHLAGRAHRPAVAILFDTPLEVCLERNRVRPERQVDETVIREQWAMAPVSPTALREEGFSAAYMASEAG